MAGFQFSPGRFQVKDAEPEQTLERFEKYLISMERVFRLNRRAHPVTGDRIDFEDEERKDIMQLEGGEDMADLFKHVGHVLDADTFAQACTKIRVALRGRGNRTAGVFKLFTSHPQGRQSFESWHRKVYEAAKLIEWAGYDADTAAVDAILIQTSSTRLQQKAMQENPTYPQLVTIGVSQEQATKKVGAFPDNETETTRALREELKKKKKELQRAGASTTQGAGPSMAQCGKCCLPRCKGGDNCPAKDRTCHKCGTVGHFTRSKACPKKKEVRKLQAEEEDSDSVESLGRIVMETRGTVMEVRAAKSGRVARNTTVLEATGPRDVTFEAGIKFITDTGVRKTIVNRSDWDRIRDKCKLVKTTIQFRPYGTTSRLPVVGRAKVQLRARAGAVITTYVYVMDSEKEDSLLGETDAERLGIVTLDPDGAEKEVLLARVVQNSRRRLRGQDGQEAQPDVEVEKTMERIANSCKEVFEGIGKYKGDPVKIQVEEGARPVIQPPRRIPLHLREPLRLHIEELKEYGVVEGPLEEEEEGTWISNLVITGKAWDKSEKKEGERLHIRGNLDCRPLNKHVYQTHEPIPTPQELRHELKGSDRFSKLDMTHCFHQFEIEEKSRKLFTFRTPWGLYRYTRMVMGNSPASSECHRRIRKVLTGCTGVVQIKDDILVHGKGDQHDGRLEEVLKRLQQAGLTLRREKCELGKAETVWFGHVFSAHGMNADEAKVQIIRQWPRPETVAEVKSFIQTLQFNAIYMGAEDGEPTYPELTAPFREVSRKGRKFRWTDEMETNFRLLKERLCSDRVMVAWDPERKTRLYTDAGPEGAQATVAQRYQHETAGETWRPVAHTARAWSDVERRYGQVEKESNGVHTGIKANNMYLAGTDFEVVVDHKPLVPLYNKDTRPKQARVDRHRMKLAQYSFKMVYEPGVRNPCDYGSRHPPVKPKYTELDREQLGVEEDDTELWVNRLLEEQLPTAITRKMLRKATAEDEQLKHLMEDIQEGTCRKALHRFDKVFEELATVDGIVMRGDQLIIPGQLQAQVVELAHEGHMGQEKTLQLLRQYAWFPNMGNMVKDWVETCVPCQASLPGTGQEPLRSIPYPEGPWQRLHADYKGPIGGWYLYAMIDQYSKYPVVKVTKSTGWDQLRPVLEEAFSSHGIPEVLTTDGGPPFNGHEMQKFSEGMGFSHKLTTPEDAQANGFAEAFIKVLVKMLHTAVVEGRDPKRAMHSYLMAYRAAPHRMTGKSPAEMLFGRKIKTKLPRMLQTSDSDQDREARARHDEERRKQKEYADKKRNAKTKHIVKGDRVMVQRKKTTTDSPWDPRPYVVVDMKGPQLRVQRGEQVKLRATNKVKVVRRRPGYLERHTKGATRDQERLEEEDEADLQTIMERGQRPDHQVEEEEQLEPEHGIEPEHEHELEPEHEQEPEQRPDEREGQEKRKSPPRKEREQRKAKARAREKTRAWAEEMEAYTKGGKPRKRKEAE
jgi:hypothetical protein